ncbi:MAG: hypothetical protein HQK65_13665 [Desulfamplus sp.]|nr:hypothetical protein [Desulfamplus sp.]
MKNLVVVLLLFVFIAGFIEVGFASDNGVCTGQPYKSTYEEIQWGCRNDDTLYCVDIFDENMNIIQQAAECAEDLHSYSPKLLSLEPGLYYWKAWSPSAFEFEEKQKELEGQFIVPRDTLEAKLAKSFDILSTINDKIHGYESTYEMIKWGTRPFDIFYCIDIYDENWEMLHQAAKCGNHLKSFSPKEELYLPKGKTYHWKVWSEHGYGGEKFEGEFYVPLALQIQSIQFPSNLSNQLSSVLSPSLSQSSDIITWNRRGSDTFYCIDIYDQNWAMLYQAAKCGEGLYAFYPEEELDLPLSVYRKTYHWMVWSESGYGGDGYQGEFSVGYFDSDLGHLPNPWDDSAIKIKWDKRGYDTFYCVDIFDKNWNILYQAAKCGEGFYDFYPEEALDLPSGKTYYWKIWSESGYGGDGYQGEFHIDFDFTSIDLTQPDDDFDDPILDPFDYWGNDWGNDWWNNDQGYDDDYVSFPEWEPSDPQTTRRFLMNKHF